MEMATSMITAAITAVGHYAPDKVVPNSFFESYLDTTDEWIISRTGIRERRYLENGAIGRVHTVTCFHYSGPTDEEPLPDSAPPPELDWDLWLGQAP